MRIVLKMLIGVLLLAGCSKESIRGSGRTITETRSVDAFTAIQLEGSAKVTTSRGEVQKLEVSGYENLLPIYETRVQNKTLILKFTSDYYNVRNSNIAVNITLPALSGIAINGSGEFALKNYTGDNLTAAINGSGDIYAENCNYNKAAIKVNGSGYIRAALLKAKEAEVEVNGSGKIEVTSNESLKAIIHGSGTINYWGNPTAVTVDVSGSGKVIKN